MSLGVLNNLSAIYAENNLNNTSNSLNTVLQQLSSGSKINSGADDAAGLSLVDGLQANSMALAQSQTNASEGVGLLTVADGALSQVTNLLNRAVTLATEASNGTLNSSQDSAANSEYQSILSEINNIGTTTTYNNQAVFGASSPVNIYTGDSSTTGASIDSLNIGTLSSSNVGDTGGTMAYSNGSNNVFVNLSTSSSNAKSSDYLNGGSSGSTTLDVNYLVKGANGSSTTASAPITVGGNSGYQNTAAGMISAINNAGLGLTATFSTQTQAGVQGGGTQTGIEISGGMVSAGVAPNAASSSGILNPSGIPASELLQQNQTITISQGGTQAIQVQVTGATDTLQTLANAINTATGNTSTANDVTTDSTKVIASVITNGDGSQSLSLANANSSLGALTVAAGGGTNYTPAFTSGTGSIATQAPAIATATNTAGVADVTAANGADNIAVAGTNGASTLLTVGTSVQVTSNGVTDTFVVGASTGSVANTYFTGGGNDTMGNLASLISGTSPYGSNGLNVTAAASSTGILVQSNTAATGDNVVIQDSTLTNATNQLSVYNPTDGGAATVGTPTTTEIYAGAGASENDKLVGSVTLAAMGGANTLTFTAGTNGTTYNDLVSYINTNSSTLGVTAKWATNLGASGNQSGILLTTTTNNAQPVIYATGANTLGDATTGNAATSAYTVTAFSPASGTAAVTDTIAGTFNYTGNGHSVAFTAGATDGTTWGDLATAINDANVGVTAQWNTTSNDLQLTSTTAGATAAVVNSGSLTDVTLATGGAATVQNFTAGATSKSTDIIGGSATFTANGQSFTYTGDGSTTTFADLATALGQSDLGVSATFANGDLTVTSLTDSNTTITMTPGTPALTDTDVNGVADTPVAVTTDSGAASNAAGSAKTPVAVNADTVGTGGSFTGTNGIISVVQSAGGTTNSGQVGTVGAGPSYATAVLQLNQSGSLAIQDATDQITGQITLANGAGTPVTFVMGGTASTNFSGTTIYTGDTTVSSLVTAINKDVSLGLSAQAGGDSNGADGAIYLQSTTAGVETGGITSSNSTLADVTYGTSTGTTISGAVSGHTGSTGNDASVTIGLNSTLSATESINSSDVLQANSSITLQNVGGTATTFTVGSGADTATSFFTNNTATDAPANTQYANTLAGMASMISQSGIGLSATASTNGLTLTSTQAHATGSIGVTSNSLYDNNLGSSSQATISGFGSESDTVTGTLSFKVGSSGTTQTVTMNSATTVDAMITALDAKGVTAAWDANTNSVNITSGTEGTSGNLVSMTSSLTDTTNTAQLSYSAVAAYSTGISSSTGANAVYDSTTSQTAASFASDSKAASGVATISYSSGAGQSLSTTDLSNQSDAEASLTALNSAITDVAAQDGYIGAQINTLNAVSSVLSTQQENVTSAQNAVQATDYASATSNMSKYEILSQTGISALAQANSMQQEVTKLLQ